MSDAAPGHGTTGKGSVTRSGANDVPFGPVTPALARVRPGHSATVTVRARVPAGAGDTSGEIVLNAANGPTSIPVTLRGLIAMRQAASPPTLWTGSFQGAATSGNGQPGARQLATYQFTVPPGIRNIDADITLSGGTGSRPPGQALPSAPFSEVTGYLVAPGGQA